MFLLFSQEVAELLVRWNWSRKMREVSIKFNVQNSMKINESALNSIIKCWTLMLTRIQAKTNNFQ
jgi:hypothetical protein